MQKQKTSKELTHRKFLLVLPVLVLPFLTLIFWILGGGKIEKTNGQGDIHGGFNNRLPDAGLSDDKPMDKMSYYVQAQLDSIKLNTLRKNDPLYDDITRDDLGSAETDAAEATAISGKPGLNTDLYNHVTGDDPNTQEIYRKLAALDREINQSIPNEKDKVSARVYHPSENNYPNAAVSSAEVEKLEQMMTLMNKSPGEDPEISQLDGMLDKILDIQYPGRIQDKIKNTSEARDKKLFPVTAVNNDESFTTLDTSKLPQSQTGFYSLYSQLSDQEVENTISAVVHETQTIVDGTTVKLRLEEDININGTRIPEDNFVFGTASLSGERLRIHITSIRDGSLLLPVDLFVYDMDGQRGIYIPGAIARDVAKQSAGQSVQSLGMTSLDQSWGAQAASAGIEAAKTLFSKKAKLIKVKVRSGYQVLLKDERKD